MVDESKFPRFRGWRVLGERPITEQEWRRVQRAAQGPRVLALVWILSSISFLAGLPIALIWPEIASVGLMMTMFGLLIGGYLALPLRNALRVKRRLEKPVSANVVYLYEKAGTTVEVLVGPNLIWVVNQQPQRTWLEATPLPDVSNPSRDESDYVWKDGDLDTRELTNAELRELDVRVQAARRLWRWYDWLMAPFALVFLIASRIPAMEVGGQIVFFVCFIVCAWRLWQAWPLLRLRRLYGMDRTDGRVYTVAGCDETGNPVLIEYMRATKLIWRIGVEPAEWRDPD